MVHPETHFPRFTPWVVVVAALGLGVLQGLQVFVSFALEGDRVTLSHAMVTVYSWLLMAALLPIPYYVSRRFPLEGRSPPHAWVAHALAALLFALLHLAANAAVHDAGSLAGFTSQFVFLLRFFFILDVVTYGAAVLAIHAWRYYRALQTRERRALTLEMELTAARLQTLRAQLDPHFLFNTLNALATLAETGKGRDLADGIAKVSELLRLSLDDRAGPQTELAKELKAVETYVDIQRLRFGDDLRFRVEADPEVLTCSVPTLLLQPLVENAIEHGRPGDGPARSVEVDAFAAGMNLVIEIRDNGPGVPPEALVAPGVGLSAVLARLEHLYGERASVVVGRGPDGGGCVRVELPIEACEYK